MIYRKAYRTDKAGDLKRLRVTEEEIDGPGSGEVLVEVKAIGLNFADIFAILGLYSATPEGSFVPGLEYAGKVLKTGEGVREFREGDRVMGVTRFGGYATHLSINASYVRKIPATWSFEEGAAFLVQALTAWYGLFTLGNLQAGETVLIHSAAGGVGLLANRMAQKTGAHTIGTVGHPSKLEVLHSEGYQKGVVRSQRFGEDLDNALEGRPLDVVMECIGGRIFKEAYERLAPRGRMVVYGSARYGDTSDRPNWLRLAWLYLTRPKIDPQKMIESNKSVHGFNLIWLYEQKELMTKILGDMESMELPPPRVGHTFPFEELPEALKLFQSGMTVGKVVVRTP